MTSLAHSHNGVFYWACWQYYIQMKFEVIAIKTKGNSLFVKFSQFPHGTLQCSVIAIYETYKDRHEKIALATTTLTSTLCDYDPFQSCSFISPLSATNVFQILRTLTHRSWGVKWSITFHSLFTLWNFLVHFRAINEAYMDRHKKLLT